MKTAAGFCALWVSLILLASCGPFKRAVPEINTASDAAAMGYGVLWAVIIEPYAAFRESCSPSAPTAAYGRRCDVEQVTARTLVPDPSQGDAKTALWYGFAKGWLPENSVLVFSNKYKAMNMADQMRPR
ncbi:MAG: hypothetical protein LBR23_02310 [Spirochaetaceae bacterium]|jgi:hypothetical protein|nr:hypothetical protein [Spirochaetaceae bacterium]